MLVILFTDGFCQSRLNDILSTYSSNIKVCNAPHADFCIYETNYVQVEQSDNYLFIRYGFAWNKERNDYISKNTIRVNLCTSTFYTGQWYFGGRWVHGGNKGILTIKDDDGIDLYTTGTQSYNQGTKQNLISSICFDMGTEPVANRVLNEILDIQKEYKDKDPWLLPEVSVERERKIANETPKKRPQKAHRPIVVKKQASNKKRVVQRTKSGKYGQ